MNGDANCQSLRAMIGPSLAENRQHTLALVLGDVRGGNCVALCTQSRRLANEKLVRFVKRNKGINRCENDFITQIDRHLDPEELGMLNPCTPPDD